MSPPNRELLYNPFGQRCSVQTCGLVVRDNGASCGACDLSYPMSDGVLETLHVDDLDPEKARELEGNTLSLDPENIERYLNKENWNVLVGYWGHRKMRLALRAMGTHPREEITFLGTGTAFEVAPLLDAGLRAKRINLSDLSITTLHIAQRRMDRLTLTPKPEFFYFTSDLDAVPLRDRESEIVIYECLHHTADLHAALERMLDFGYREIHLVEPTTNWVIRRLAHRGLAQRVEYSGVNPDRLDLRLLRGQAKRSGYDVRIRTIWQFPDDYAAAVGKRLRLPTGWAERLSIAVCEVLTVLGRPFRFGNFSVCTLRRRDQ